MKVVTPGQMNMIDSISIQKIGIPGIVLMENAALQVLKEIIKDLGDVRNKTIAVFAGKGNNGGDGFALARHLFNRGTNVKVFAVPGKKEIKGDAKLNLDIVERIGVSVVEVNEKTKLDEVRMELLSVDMIVDGIFGTGLKGPVEGLVKDIIDMINSSGRKVIAIDIPSGIRGETGTILGTCVKADKTVTFGLPKVGMLLHPGCENIGEMVVADIGIPAKVIDEMSIKTNVIDAGDVSNLIPERASAGNKGEYGKILLVTGSTGMTGAGRLAGEAALRTGAGLVYLGVPASLVPVYESGIIESVTVPLDDKGTGTLSRESAVQILERMKNANVAAIGPGLSVGDDIVSVIRDIIDGSTIPLVLDADALNAVSRDITMLKGLKVQAVLTPHPGEMARLTGKNIKDIQQSRIETAITFAAQWNVIVVLKGARTVIAQPDGTVFINVTGNPGMATGGTGDVLTGIIAGLIGQGLKSFDAAVAGVFLHGFTGDTVAKIMGERGLIASDMVKELPYIIKKICGS